MRNLNPIYEDVWYPGAILGGAVGGGAGFLISKLVDKYFIKTNIQKLMHIKGILLNTDSFSEFQNKAMNVDPKFSVVLKQYEKYPNWKETLLALLDKKINQKKMLQAGVKGLGTVGGAVAGGMIGNNLEPNKPLPGITDKDLFWELPDYMKNRPTILDVMDDPNKYRESIPYGGIRFY